MRVSTYGHGCWRIAASVVVVVIQTKASVKCVCLWRSVAKEPLGQSSGFADSTARAIDLSRPLHQLKKPAVETAADTFFSSPFTLRTHIHSSQLAHTPTWPPSKYILVAHPALSLATLYRPPLPYMGDQSCRSHLHFFPVAFGRFRKILLLGSGFVAEPCVEYLCRRPENKVTIGTFALLPSKKAQLLRRAFLY